MNAMTTLFLDTVLASSKNIDTIVILWRFLLFKFRLFKLGRPISGGTEDRRTNSEAESKSLDEKQ